MTALHHVFAQYEDDFVRKDVARQIAGKPEIASRYISVRVVDGTVTLSGFVQTYLEKTLAERTAKSVLGALAVTNNIEVRIYRQRSDFEILGDVVHALRLQQIVPNDSFKATVHDGLVTLEGKVCSNFQRKSAERAAQAVYGVLGVISTIEVVLTLFMQQAKT